MANNKFYSDLAFGNKFEKLSLSSIEPYDRVEFPPEGVAHSGWDYKAFHKDGTVVTYEVKADKMCERTGNFFIETANKAARPSGLATTKADVYILIKVSKNDTIIDTYLIDTELMHKFNTNKTFQRREPPYAPVYGFLLPEKHLISIC